LKNLGILQDYFKEKSQVSQQEFTGVVIQITVMIGCKQPDELLNNILWKLLATDFGDINLYEFTRAFKMNMMNQLEEKVDHYQQFSGDFMATVLIQYRKVKNLYISRLETMESQFRLRLPQPETATGIGTLQAIIQDFEEEKIFFISEKFLILEKHSLLNLTHEQKEAYVVKAKGVIKASQVYAKTPSDAQRIGMILETIAKEGTHSNLKYEARRLAYLDFLADKANQLKVKSLYDTL